MDLPLLEFLILMNNPIGFIEASTPKSLLSFQLLHAGERF